MAKPPPLLRTLRSVSLNGLSEIFLTQLLRKSVGCCMAVAGCCASGRVVVDVVGGSVRCCISVGQLFVSGTVVCMVPEVIKRYVGHTEHHIKNSEHFAQKIKDLHIEEDELLVSYDIVALYPSIPQEEAIDLIHDRMTNDTKLSEATPMTAQQITNLFRTIVKQTYFVFDNQLYSQCDGLAIGAATSGFAANIYMERSEQRALQTFVDPPSIWMRYVDDTFSKLKRHQVDSFLAHLNAQHPRIQFTTETEHNGQIAFLDALIHRQQDGSIKLTIYRKATHTDQYLDWNSNHHLSQKTGIIQTFKNRIQTLVTDQSDQQKELQHAKRALQRCGHPNWSLKRKAQPSKQARDPPLTKVVIPYTKMLSEKLARTFNKFNIGTIHKPTQTICSTLCSSLKDPINKYDRANTIYKIDYTRCDKTYVGEAERSLRCRAKDHGLLTHREANTSHSLQPQ